MAEFCTNHSATAVVEFKHRPPATVLLCDSTTDGVGTEVTLKEITAIVSGHGSPETYKSGMKVKHCSCHGPFFARGCKDFCTIPASVPNTSSPLET